MALPIQLLKLMGLSLISAIVLELLQWLIVFRKPAFRQFKDRLAFNLRKLESIRGGAGGKLASKTPKERKQERLENTLKMETSRQFQSFSLWTKGLSAVGMFITYRIASKWLDGQVLAKLPFEPQWFFRKVTHKGLPGSDFTDASMTIMFTICTACIKANLGQALQLGPNRAMQKMMMANQKQMWNSSQNSAKAVLGTS